MQNQQITGPVITKTHVEHYCHGELMLAVPLAEVKSGVFTDKRGHKYKIVNGKRVKLSSDVTVANKPPKGLKQFLKGKPKAVKSSYLKAAKYHPEEKTLRIEFHNKPGVWYPHGPVEEKHATAFYVAPSKGKHYHEHLKHKYIRPKPEKKSAVVIKGNPKFIENNPKADEYYQHVKEYLESKGYSVEFDPGEEFTEPKKADLWVGHSRGADRLRFAPKNTKVIALGSNQENAINHPEDDVHTPFHKTGGRPPVAHFVLSDEMREKLDNLLEKKPEIKDKVLAHIAGPSGAGKTTLANKLQKEHPSINFKDLDEFDEEAEKQLGYQDTRKKNYTDDMLSTLAERRQKLMDEYIQKSDKPIVLVGHHTEGDHVLNIPTKNKYMLDIDAKTAAQRGYERSQKEDPKYRRLKSELPADEKEAQEVIDQLKGFGYKPIHPDKVSDLITKGN